MAPGTERVRGAYRVVKTLYRQVEFTGWANQVNLLLPVEVISKWKLIKIHHCIVEVFCFRCSDAFSNIKLVVKNKSGYN